MTNGSRDSNPDNLKSSVFNTINLINDIEAGETTSKKSQSMQKEVKLSERFVKGVNEKLVDYSKADPRSQNSMTDTEKEHLKQSNDKLQSQISELKEVISSNDNQIRELRSALENLKSQVASMMDNAQQQPSQSYTQKENDQQDSADSFYERQSSLMQEPAQEESSVESIPSMEFSNQPSGDDESQQSIFDPMKDEMDNSNGIDDEGSNFVFPNSTESYTEAPRNSEDPKPESGAASQDVAEKSNDSGEGNPRVGNYESGDVLIEKYFYYGNN